MGSLQLVRPSQPNPFNVLQSRRVEFSDKNLKVGWHDGYCVTNNLSRGIAIKPHYLLKRKVPNKLDAGTEDSSRRIFFTWYKISSKRAGYPASSGMGRNADAALAACKYYQLWYHIICVKRKIAEDMEQAWYRFYPTPEQETLCVDDGVRGWYTIEH